MKTGDVIVGDPLAPATRVTVAPRNTQVLTGATSGDAVVSDPLAPGAHVTVAGRGTNVLIGVGTPGPKGDQGPPGVLDAAQMDQVAEDASERVNEDLEPLVDLVILFENSLA